MRLEDLERELRAERPEPDLDFARQLDEWAEAGFPRDRGLGPRTTGRKGALQRAWERVTAVPPRRILAPVGALACLVFVVGVVATQVDTNGGGGDPATQSSSSDAGSAAEPPAAVEQDAGGAATESAAPSAAEPAPDSSEEFELSAPSDAVGGADDGIARGTDDRIVDATARLSLGAEADEVQDVANGVVDVTDRYDGVVVDSQVTSDQTGARASFELELPYAPLDQALADLSELGDVISRTETTEDITARAVRARKDLAELHDRIREARVELIQADTREERLVLRSEIASLQASADAAEAELNGTVRQGRFATVEVDVRSDETSSDDGDWSLGDAADDAGRVLEVMGGVALVTIAILLPIALVAGVAAFALSRSRARARERALDQ